MWQHGCTQDIPVPHPSYRISMVRLSYLNVHRPILPSLLGATHLSILRTLRPRTPGLSGRTPCMFPAIQERRGHKQRSRRPDTGSCRLARFSNYTYSSISIQPILGHPSWLGGAIRNVWQSFGCIQDWFLLEQWKYNHEACVPWLCEIYRWVEKWLNVIKELIVDI